MSTTQIDIPAGISRSWRLVTPRTADEVEAAAWAASRTSDRVIYDLEDGIAELHKDEARHATTRWLQAGHHAWVRITPAPPRTGSETSTCCAESQLGAKQFLRRLNRPPRSTEPTMSWAERCR